MVAVTAGGDPPHDGAVAPDGFVANGVCITGLHHETYALAQGALGVFAQGGFAADEFALAQRHETAQSGLERAVNRAELARPGAEALLAGQRQ